MKILIIGGSKFIGKEISNYCVNYGHEVFLFNRGKTASGNLNTIIGDINNLIEYKDKLKQEKFNITKNHSIIYSTHFGVAFNEF